MRDFRNKPFPVRTKIEYYNKVLTVGNGLISSLVPEKLLLGSKKVWVV